MEVSRRICLYGNSVILGTLGASLRRCSQFKVIEINPPYPGSSILASLNPQVVVFDLEAENNEAVFSLLKILPELLLVGISPDKNLVKTWSGQQLQELSTQDLLEIINGQLKDSPVS